MATTPKTTALEDTMATCCALPAELKNRGPFVHSQCPAILEFSFQDLSYFLTDNSKFFVRNHFSNPPDIDGRDFRLKIEGSVKRTYNFTLAELLRIRPHAVIATIECAGNGRAFLEPRISGIQWSLGAVGTAEWVGVSLASLLEIAGVSDTAVEVILEGADQGWIRTLDSSSQIQFARSLPISKARSEEVLIAYLMNGRTLPREHGYPLRAIVPGWYGMASVKWLQRIVVTEKPFTGHFQSFDYTYRGTQQGSSVQKIPVTELEVKTQIARPQMNEAIAGGSYYRIEGAAWSGESAVKSVDLSTDGAQSWTPCSFLDPATPYAWRRWEYKWIVPRRPGRMNLLARATDSKGRIQPMHPDLSRNGYMTNHVLPISVRMH